ncbi:hypothetical protein pipiens_008310 [Culex pipiens pipiens]|uniref:Uncharacterized protein n=1 Tax=Culex pipiens pipiens TaxID=38569 RepID=A0ABD1DLP3_CULPP
MFRFWLISTIFLLHSVSGTYLVLNPYLAGGAGGNEFTWGTPMGTMCYQNTVKSYYPVTTTTFYINTATNINYIRCWSGSGLFPINAMLVSGGVGTRAANVQLSSLSAKLIGGCEAMCA